MYKESIQPKYFPTSKSIKYSSTVHKKLQEVSIEEFERLTSLQYLYHLSFKDKAVYEKIKRLCKRGIQNNTISKRAEWLGIRYRREILHGIVNDVYIQWINNQMGFGLFANTFLNKWDFIGEYTGVIRPCTYFFANVNEYCFRYPLYRIGYHVYTIDSQDCCNETSFINHSNNPNCESIVTFNNDILHVGIRTIRDIQKNEELTIDYGNNMWGSMKDS
ncbi:MAG: SET domain-containing protein-lysine N-methyltransferase [Chlamydiota bacterium]|nr:SET domain-containing protein-lysine N-methyltransferase [Chlamydiota bacterium]